METKLFTRSFKRVVPNGDWINTSADVDVAVWIDGYLRGSSIRAGGTLQENIKSAAEGALVDSRFRAVEASEIGRARIEVVVMHDLFIPLTDSDLERPIETHVGYAVALGGKLVGWYLPQVFNSIRFDSLQTLVNQLITRKAKIPEEKISATRTYSFSVIDIIEESSSGYSHILVGPVPTTENSLSVSERVLCASRSAILWLSSITEPNGFLPPIVQPDHFARHTYDPLRAAHVALALSELSKAFPDTTTASLAARIADYAYRTLLHFQQTDISMLAKTYLGQYYYSSGALIKAKDMAEIVLTYMEESISTNTILLAQVARLHQLLGTGKELPIIHSLADEFFNTIEKGQHLSLAAYAELLTLTLNDGVLSNGILSWYRSQQLPSGAFPNLSVPSTPYTYVRGTGKILEALATTTENLPYMLKGFSWVLRYQYTEGSTFHIPTEMLPKLLGGFRHDDLNREAWIDAGSHFIIASARYLASKGRVDPEK